MNEIEKSILYKLVWETREMTCGSNVQPIQTVVYNLQKTIRYAKNVNAPETIITRLERANEILLDATKYADRLPADNLLCTILNEDLGG